MPSPARPCRSGAGSLGGHQQAQALDVALGDPVRRIALERLLVGLERLRMAPELGEGLAQAVAGVDVGPQLEQLAVRRRPPPPTRRASRARSPSRPAGGAAGWSCRRLRASWSVMQASPMQQGSAAGPAESAPLYHRPGGVSTRGPPARACVRAGHEAAQPAGRSAAAPRTRSPQIVPSPSLRRASTAPAHA